MFAAFQIRLPERDKKKMPGLRGLGREFPRVNKNIFAEHKIVVLSY